MSATTWWWVRHGPTHRKDMIGWTDAPADLSDKARLARLGAALPKGAPVVSSDLLRATATADAVQGARARLPHSQNLREIHFGRWEEMSFARIEAEDGALSRRFWEHPGAVTAPGGESWDGLSHRVNGFVDSTPAPRHIIVVAHMGPILCQLQRALGLSAYAAFSHKIDNLSVTALTHEQGRWHVEMLNHHPR